MNNQIDEKLTVIIHTHNEESNIRECIQSARKLTKNITVIDMESTDKTLPIIKEEKIQSHSFPYSHYVEPARAFGIHKAKSDWIFILDADERLTDELVSEIKNTITSTGYSYYKVPRKEFFAKKVWLQHGGWWPNHQIRLVSTNHFKEWPDAIHSTPVITGKLGHLTNPLIHYSKNDYEEIVNKTIVFEDVESNLLFKAGRSVKVSTFFRKFLGELYRRLIRKQGFKDGSIGIIESIYQAFSKTITYIYLYEKKKNSTV